MKWNKVTAQLPPRKEERYQVLVIATKTYSEGHYEGKGILTVVQDWVVRRRPKNFTHWAVITEP